MEAKITHNQDVTNYISRGEDGKWYIVWEKDCYPYKTGKREHPESWALEQAYQEGIREVVDWINENAGLGATTIDELRNGYQFVPIRADKWQAQLEKWGIG